MLKDEIYEFLTTKGFCCTCGSLQGTDIIRAMLKDGTDRIILPVEITATCPEEAVRQSDNLKSAMESITKAYGQRPVMITADRWKSQRKMMEKRLPAHLEVFFPVFARNCEIRRIEKAEAAAFLNANHSYGDAACRYRYGMFLKRHTGRRAADIHMDYLTPGTLVAVAEFSNARKWQKGDKVIRSYEWTRYASLPDIRINGGMGKMLRHFIKEAEPDDIMSYADLEWSEGEVYEHLGFVLEGHKEAVTFVVDMEAGVRRALGARSFADARDDKGNAQSDKTDARGDMKNAQDDMRGIPEKKSLYFQNFGSNKYRLKLTDYR